MQRNLLVPVTLAMMTCIAGCTTNIHAQDDTIKPSKAPLGSYQTVSIRPLTVEKYGGDDGDKRAVSRIETELSACLSRVFPGAKPLARDGEGPNGALLIDPAIVDLKKVDTAERIFAGALAGSSAVLLRTRYTDTASGTVLAAPVFYAKANAMGGAWTFGSTDNGMLTRIVADACNYAKSNL